MMKKLLTLILALAIIAAAAAVPAMAEEVVDNTVDNALEAAVETVDEIVAEDAVEVTEPDEEADEVVVQEKAVDLAETAAQGYPVITAADATANGIRVQWKAYDGAAKYRVFYKNDSGKWAKVGDTTGLYYDHKSISLDVDYTYTVRAIGSDGAYCSSFDTNGITGRKENPPTISKIENIAGGVTVSFTRPRRMSFSLTPDVVYLYVTGGTYGSKWKLIGTSYNNTVSGAIDAKNSGTALKYTLRSKNAGGNFTSVCSTVKSATYVATPVFAVNAVSNGQQIKITAVKGAAKYRIFIMGSNSKWQKLVDTASTTYVNKNVKVGGMYCYTVRALNSAGSYVSGYIKSGISVRYLAIPKLTKLEQGTGYLKISWGAVQNARYYRVFRINPGESKWTWVGDAEGTSFSDYDLDGSGRYTYTVRCIDNLGYYTSWYDTKGLSIEYTSIPEIYYVENDEEGATLLWTSESSVPTYRLFVKQDGKWVKVADTDEDYYTVTGLEEGESYVFTVRGLDAAGKYCTAYDPAGFRVTYYKDAERTFDAYTIKQSIKMAAMDAGSYLDVGDLSKSKDALRFAVAYSGFYGENTGNITENLQIMAEQNVSEYAKLMKNYGYDLGDFAFDGGYEIDEEGEYIFYYYLKEY